MKDKAKIPFTLVRAIRTTIGDHPFLPSVSIYFQGCDAIPKCEEFHNPETCSSNEDFKIEYKKLEDIVFRKVELLLKTYNKVTLCLLGEKPLTYRNRKYAITIAKKVKLKYDESIVTILHSWRKLEEVGKVNIDIPYFDKMVPGRFSRNIRTNSFSPSLNQLYIVRSKNSKELWQILEIEELDWEIDPIRFTEKFFNQGLLATTIDSNANIRSTNVYTYLNEVSKPWTKLYSISKIYQKLKSTFSKEDTEYLVRYQIMGDIYVHDTHQAGFIPYCYTYSLKKIVNKGLFFMDTIKSTPFQHLSSFIQHVIQFVMFASNQQSETVGLPNSFVWTNYFYRKDIKDKTAYPKNSKRELYQYFQLLIYSLNQPIRGTQSPYKNFIYLDRSHIREIFSSEKYPNGQPIINSTEEIIELQNKHGKWISEERDKQIFTFPVLTAVIVYKDEKFIAEDSEKFINKLNLKWQGTNWYISNNIDAIASCCTLTSSIRDTNIHIKSNTSLKGMFNSIGGTNINIGSFKVISINLPRISPEVSSREEFIKSLREKVRIVHKVLASIGEILKDRIKQGVLPLYTLGLMNLDRQYGTVRIDGVFEATEILGLTKDSIDGIKFSKEGEKFVIEIPETIREENKKASMAYGLSFNLEQLPAEKLAIIFAERDRILYKTKYHIYSNQWLQLTVETDIPNRIRYSRMYDRLVSGGAILHVNINSPFRSEEESWQMINLLAKMEAIYFAFNQKISVCKNGHGFYGCICPGCGNEKEDEFYRIARYPVPTKSYHKARMNHGHHLRKQYSLITEKFLNSPLS
ncbi:MAG: anaerobic ribonucleoside-triphosphate reductase [Brevinematales bacterium]|nr:anaerobic ribonucleoside-triphosphate reductase [Brevinematales bacterium]